MASRLELTYCLGTNQLAATTRAIVEQGLTPAGMPEKVKVDLEKVAVDDEWVERLLAGGDAMATWNDGEDLISPSGDCVLGTTSKFELDPAALVRRLGRIPFTVASFATFHNWAYQAPSFGELHRPLGWGCAFQGAGHDRLASRRWLATAPYRILRGPGDTTLVQLHDFALGSEQALVQARVFHADLMAGMVRYRYEYRTELKGLHKGSERALVFTVQGRVVSPQELLDAAAARLLQPFGPDKPIDKVVYVFIDRAAADAQLPTMWRYGHRVHLIGDDGVERRIDDTYVPRLERPAGTSGDAAKELMA